MFQLYIYIRLVVFFFLYRRDIALAGSLYSVHVWIEITEKLESLFSLCRFMYWGFVFLLPHILLMLIYCNFVRNRWVSVEKGLVVGKIGL